MEFRVKYFDFDRFCCLKLLVKTDFDHVIKVMLYKGFENDEIRKVNDDANTS